MAGNVPYSEKESLLLIAAGNEAAFAEFFYHTSPSILLTVQQLVKAEDIAHDLLQDVYIKAWLHRKALTEMEFPLAWLKKTATNACINYLRRTKVEANWLREVSVHLVPEKQDSLSSEKELRHAIHEAIEQLPPQRKKIYQLSREQGLNRKAIAQELGLSEHTVKNQLVSALQSIKTFLEKKGLLALAMLIRW